MLGYSLTTLGCKVNQYDGSAIAEVLQEAGLERVDPRVRPPDLVVVNTCCITCTAMQKSRQALRKSMREAPQAAVAVLGCYCDYDAAKIRELLQSFGVRPERALVVGHHGTDLSECLRRFAAGIGQKEVRSEPVAEGTDPAAGLSGNDVLMKAACSNSSVEYRTRIRAARNRAVKENLASARGLPSIRRFPGHQRAFVKVQDGCDAFCAYCVVPYTRSVVWSRSAEDIVTECRSLMDSGHKEIVLAGVFLGAYGRPTAIRKRWSSGPSPLVDLVGRVADIEGLWRVRLSSLEPGDLTDELLALWRSSPKLAPHFHLPLQSGSQRILREMNRQYGPEEFLATVERVRGGLDRPAISTDIIVGFPGETKEDFAQTLSIARDVGFTKIHAFPFSAIEGTVAYERRRDAPTRVVVRKRLKALKRVEQETAYLYRSQFVGEDMEGLVEGARASREPYRDAMTDRYLTIRFTPPTGEDLTGRVLRFQITGETSQGLDGLLSSQ
jgi:threonylcarbamoyladenosine tRNA methylthiotransferase MtaB